MLNFARAGVATAFIVAAAGLSMPAPTAAQGAQAGATVTTQDIQRLQDDLRDISDDISRARRNDPQRAQRLETDLDEVRDDVTYLRVALRRGDRVTRSDYDEVRRRLDDLRDRARREAQGGGLTTAPPARTGSGDERGTAGRTTGDTQQPRTSRPNEVPVGQELDVRLQTALTSDTAQVEDRFEATTVVDLYQGDRVLIPAGSVLRGVVSSVQPAGRVERTGRLTLAFDQITVRGQSYPIRATVTDALESEGIRGEAGRIGAGAGVGAIIGGILGGVRGALAGILIGGGGTIAATEGTDVKLPVGTVLRIRMDQPVTIK
jgi:TolA-binding protein